MRKWLVLYRTDKRLVPYPMHLTSSPQHFNCEDIDWSIQQVLKQGGSIAIPKTKIQAEGKGYFAVFTDPAGNRIGLYAD